MDKYEAEKLKTDNQTVWLLGTLYAMPVKARIAEICNDEHTGVYAKVDFITGGECGDFGSQEVKLNDLYQSKDDLVAAVFERMCQRTAEVMASIQTKDDCIRFMFAHNVSCGDEYADWAARRAIQKIAKKRWGIDLE